MRITPTSTKLLEYWNLLHRAWKETQKLNQPKDVPMKHNQAPLLISAKRAREISKEMSDEEDAKIINKEIIEEAELGQFCARFTGHISDRLHQRLVEEGYSVTTESEGEGSIEISWK
jgi:hypothetical protein